ncbi:MAG TPA: O-antigen ligase family protein [Oscillatoriales cyanobacterium M59_W2019_021]|nr:O-antigen ligase family protein [Oscillatoriales cyanobacterium M4454_W2019_049]HIK51931.1 O-antigen ligase family protein [Oscillatoriales cyanobacterium M59_W2019_021]
MYQIAYWLSLLAIFAVPWENLSLIGGLGSISRIIGVLVGLCWLAAMAVRGRVRPPHLFHFVFLVFILWNTLSVCWSVAPERSIDRSLTYWQLLVFVYLLWDIYTTQTKIRWGLQAYILGCYVTIYSLVGSFSSGAATRYSAEGFNSNVAGMILALGISIAWYLALFDEDGQKNQVFKWMNLAYIPLSLLCILLTGSRSALMGAFPGILFILNSLQRFNPIVRTLIFAFLIGVGLALLPFANTAIDRMTGASFTHKSYLNGRDKIWQKGIEVFAEHPMLGVGSFAFSAAATDTTEHIKVAHSFVLALLSEVGLVGFSLFIALLGISLYCAFKQPKWTSQLWAAVIVGWIFSAVTQNMEHRKQTWLFLTLSVCSACVSRSKPRPSTPHYLFDANASSHEAIPK